MIIAVKKISEEAVIPKKANSTDAGFDLVAIDDGIVDSEGFLQYRTGLSIAPQNGLHTNIFPRSSISKYDLVLANSVGLVDNGYRGELLVRFKPTLRFMQGESGTIEAILPSPLKKYKKGDKIAQLVVSETISVSFVEWAELGQTERGSGGFGSSGN